MHLRRFAAVAGLCALAACSRTPSSVLKQGPRFPDAEGVATLVTLERIQIDGRHAFTYSPRVESFTTRGHDVTPLLSWQGKYVQLALDDKHQVAWVAGIGSVVKVTPPYTLYSGNFDHVDKRTHRAVFKDGTTLRIERGVKVPRPGECLVTIDPSKHAISKIAAVST